MNIQPCVLLIYLSLLCFSCKNSPSEKHLNTSPLDTIVSVPAETELQASFSALEGDWEVVAARRNGKDTETLNTALFSFIDTQTMSTNLLGDDMESNYILEGNKITQSSAPLLVFDIKRLASQELVLATEIQGFKFDLNLSRIGAEDERLEPAQPQSK